MSAPLLREKQKHALKCMINLNNVKGKATTSSSTEPSWKLLVYDRTGQDIISPLLSVKELRDLGVTLHMYIHSDRDSIPEVPVIYFLMPTEENITRICQDFKNQLYDNFYLNFITPISRQKLEDLASTALQANVASSISKIFDQYSYFISLEDDMFALREHDRDCVSYYAINRGDVKDTEMDGVMNSIVDGLLSVFVTLGVVPVIRSPKGNAAEMVAEKLNRKIKQNIQDLRNNLFVSGDNFTQEETMPRPRPLLIVLDRNMDMTTPLHHTWTYQALAHDVLNLKLNQIRIEDASEDSSGRSKPKEAAKTYDLNTSDKFWHLHKGSPFPQVAEAVQEELESYRASEEEVKRLKAAMGLEASDEAVVLLNDATAKLNFAVSSLPELLEKKKYIDMHTTIASSMLDQIKNRKLDSFFEVEEKIMSRSMLDKSPIELILDQNIGTPGDKLRLFLIHFLCNPSLSPEELKQFEKALQEAGCDLNPTHYMKRWKTFSKGVSALSTANTHYGGGTKTVNMFSKLMTQGSQFVMEGVKNLVVKKHILPVTRIADALMENKTIQECEDFLYLDPKLKKADSAVPTNVPPFQDAVIFMVGGGNYIEYQNLMDYCKLKSAKTTTPKRIIYGCTDVMNADQFLSQLSKLGEEL